MPKILSAEKFCPPKILSAEIFSDKVLYPNAKESKNLLQNPSSQVQNNAIPKIFIPDSYSLPGERFVPKIPEKKPNPGIPRIPGTPYPSPIQKEQMDKWILTKQKTLASSFHFIETKK